MDVKDCQKAYRVGFKPKGIIHEKARMVAFNSIRVGLSEGLRETLPDSEVDQYELVSAVIAAMSDSAVERWLAGEKLFGEAKLTPDSLESPTSNKESGSTQ